MTIWVELFLRRENKGNIPSETAGSSSCSRPAKATETSRINSLEKGTRRRTENSETQTRGYRRTTTSEPSTFESTPSEDATTAPRTNRKRGGCLVLFQGVGQLLQQIQFWKDSLPLRDLQQRGTHAYRDALHALLLLRGLYRGYGSKQFHFLSCLLRQKCCLYSSLHRVTESYRPRSANVESLILVELSGCYSKSSPLTTRW